MNPLHDEVKRLHIALAELLKIARIYGDTWVPKTNPSWQVYLARAEAALDGREPAVLEPVAPPVVQADAAIDILRDLLDVGPYRVADEFIAQARQMEAICNRAYNLLRSGGPR